MHVQKAQACLVFAVFLMLFLAASCSGSESAQPSASDEQANDSATPNTEAVDTETPDTETSSTAAPSPTSIPAPTLADEELAEVIDLQAGEQVEDAQGNLLAIYGFVEWPEPFQVLSDAAQQAFPFFGDVEELADPTTELVALDVGMCAAGIDATGFGTAEFFLHESARNVLSTDPVLNRGVLARHPVIQPGFDFPKSAECARGWLPVLWNGTEVPTTARYVLTTRVSADDEVSRHVYQWNLAGSQVAEKPEPAVVSSELFGIGQTVTFNQGALAATTVVVDGWAELIGAPSSIESTRRVAVSLTYCPSSPRLPDFGLAVDGWNLIAPDAGSTLLGARSAGDPSQSCFDGWLEFTVPFGAIPTGFFASDGIDPAIGYAEWSLEEAALAAPQ